MTKASK